MSVSQRRLKRRLDWMKRNVFGQLSFLVECLGVCADQPVLAEVELHRSPESDEISVNVTKCEFAEPRGGHGGYYCTAEGAGGDWCKFSFDYPSDMVGNESWCPPHEIAIAFDAIRKTFGIE